MDTIRIPIALILVVGLSACGDDGLDESEEVSNPSLDAQQKTVYEYCQYEHYSWCNAQEWNGHEWVCTETCHTKVSYNCPDYGTIECSSN